MLTIIFHHVWPNDKGKTMGHNSKSIVGMGGGFGKVGKSKRSGNPNNVKLIVIVCFKMEDANISFCNCH
jgi:hypothetical protein